MSTANTTTTTATATGLPDSIEANLLLIAEAVQKMNKEKMTRPKEDRDDVANVLVLLCFLMLVIAVLIYKGFDDICNKMDKNKNAKGRDDRKNKITAFRLDLNLKTECSGGHVCSGRHHGHYYVPPYAVPPEYQPRRQTTPHPEGTY